MRFHLGGAREPSPCRTAWIGARNGQAVATPAGGKPPGEEQHGRSPFVRGQEAEEEMDMALDPRRIGTLVLRLIVGLALLGWPRVGAAQSYFSEVAGASPEMGDVLRSVGRGTNIFSTNVVSARLDRSGRKGLVFHFYALENFG